MPHNYNQSNQLATFQTTIQTQKLQRLAFNFILPLPTAHTYMTNKPFLSIYEPYSRWPRLIFSTCYLSFHCSLRFHSGFVVGTQQPFILANNKKCKNMVTLLAGLSSEIWAEHRVAFRLRLVILKQPWRIWRLSSAAFFWINHVSCQWIGV